MITMNRRRIGYSKVCSSVQDSAIKIWLWIQQFCPETYIAMNKEAVISKLWSEDGQQNSKVWTSIHQVVKTKLWSKWSNQRSTLWWK